MGSEMCIRDRNGTPIKERTAKFRTVIAFVKQEEKLWTEGLVEGLILDQRKGSGGFGYDSIFYYQELNKTFAELKKSEKNNISHRGKALRNFCKILEKRIKTNG